MIETDAGKARAGRWDDAGQSVWRWLSVGFFVTLLVFVGNNLLHDYDRLAQAAAARHWAETTADISQTIDQLQRERSLTVAYLSGSGNRFASIQAFERQLDETDAALARLSGILGAAQRPVAGANFAELRELRSAAEERRMTHDVASQRYTVSIEQLLTLLLSRLDASDRMAIPQLMLASFLRAKEAAGQEQALVTVMLASGDFGPSRIAAHNWLRAIEAARLVQFRLLAADDLRDLPQAFERGPLAQELGTIRQSIAAIGQSAAPPKIPAVSAEHWFTLAAQRLDMMQAVEAKLLAAIADQSAELQDKAWRALVFNAILALAAIVLITFLIYRMLRYRKTAETRLRLSSVLFDSSVETVIITDAALRITDVNPAFCRISGYAREELIGRHVRRLRSNRQDLASYVAIWRQLAHDGRWQGEIWNRRRDGGAYPSLLSIVAVRHELSGVVSSYVGMSIDLSQHKQTEELLERLRTFDGLTGLLSRDAWRATVERSVVQARSGQQRFAVLRMGVDRFKLINDSLNHSVGDEVLAICAKRIRSCVRYHDIVARTGGDLFSVLLDDIASTQGVVAVCEKLLAAFYPPMTVDEHQLHISVSIGVAIFPDDGEDLAMLERNAESAMFHAKEEGRATYRFYSTEINVGGVRLLALEGLLRQALANGEFGLEYQPQVDALSNRLVGVEALLRWRSPQLGSVSPVQFIPVAEETGVIIPIGEWVLREACRQMRAWVDEFGCEMTVAVNLSGRQFRQNDLLQVVSSALTDSGLPPRLLELEITEGMLVANPGGAVEVLRGLRELGVRLAIDDFGTGYSSLAYLKTFPLDRLKIDRAFVRDLPSDGQDTAISRTIVALGRNLHLEVLAEGVETPEQQAFLADIGCQVLQGYLHGRPMTAEALTQQVRDGHLCFTA
ncbi:MAG: EAL domain-containing protein [Azonexus sp.]|jgi:diguanylate cyclase (GGDEF)-like protein/PAS domain S-box-containing protein|nr:EAL domain-containing protein [Azonexus sp.]